jgi:vacuolar-type H+-ATPase subunit E/Vma4
MADNLQHSQEMLREEILTDARRQAERALQHARKEAAEITAASAAEISEWSARQLDLARTEAQRRTDMILAGLPVEIGRLRADRIESLLQSIHDEACRQLLSREELDYRQVVINLAAAAIRGMSGVRFSITLPKNDLPLLGDDEINSIRHLTGRPDLELELTGDPESRDAGPIVYGSDGGEFWDNRLTARLERLWPVMRREIAVRTALLEPVESEGNAS